MGLKVYCLVTLFLILYVNDGLSFNQITSRFLLRAAEVCKKRNEIFTPCTLHYCETLCEHLRLPPACPESVPATCYQPGCVCPEQWLRDSTGKCVPYVECPEFFEVMTEMMP